MARPNESYLGTPDAAARAGRARKAAARRTPATWRSRRLQWDEQWDYQEAVMGRTHVILSDEVIEAIDERVGERGRSRFLEEAAREKLERLDVEAAVTEGAGLLKEKDYPYWRDTASVQE